MLNFEINCQITESLKMLESMRKKYSDGIIEMVNSKPELFSEEFLMEIIATNAEILSRWYEITDKSNSSIFGVLPEDIFELYRDSCSKYNELYVKTLKIYVLSERDKSLEEIDKIADEAWNL